MLKVFCEFSGIVYLAWELLYDLIINGSSVQNFLISSTGTSFGKQSCNYILEDSFFFMQDYAFLLRNCLLKQVMD